MSSKYLNRFINAYGDSSGEASLWVSVIEQAKLDLTHKRKEVREDARSFLFDEEDDRMSNLLNMLGLDGDVGKAIVRMYGD